MGKLVSGRVKKTPQSGITSDRYEFLGLEQAEPDLGDPTIGVSSVGVKPYAGNITDLYVLTSDSTGGGSRYWVKQPNVISGGVINPGSITVRDEGVIIGSVNQITDLNFVGNGVTVTSPADWVGAGSSSAQINITVTDVAVSGNIGAIPYKSSTGYLQGANDFIYSSSNQNIGIGSTLPTSKLDVTGNIKASGIATVGVISATTGVIGVLTANTITSGFVTSTNAFVGVLTASTLNGTTGSITNIAGTSGTFANLNVTTLLQVDTNTIYTSSSSRNVGFGTTNPLQKVQVGSASNAVVITSTGRVGIGTTNPNYNFDVIGDSSFNGKIWLGGTSGTAGQVIISGGTGNPSWGSSESITVGSANSVGIANTQLSATFYPTFTSQTQNNAYLRINTNGLAYNPGLNYFGIGTSSLNYTLTVNGTVGVNSNALFVSSTNNRVGLGTTIPSSTLDVRGNVNVASNVSVGTTVTIGVSTIASLSSGIVTTTTTSNVALSSIDTNTFRSSKYNVQITCTGQLVSSASSSSSVSVSSLQGGTNYVSGNYTNVGLSTVSGTGTDALANIQVTPEKYIALDNISSGTFNTSNDTTGINVNAPVVFSRAISATPAQNSTVTSITVTNTGSGYTSVPTIGIATPTNNPSIFGVTGIGSTATASVSTLIVTNVTVNNPGIHTVIPTISFRPPVGSGVSATGIVGVGLSTITVTNAGSGYLESPVNGIRVENGGIPIVDATVGISSVFVTDIAITGTGLGYTSGKYPILTISAPNIGVNTATAIVTSLGISTHFTITPGIGYTRPPILQVGAPNVGINTATITATLGVTTFVVSNPGSGYTSSPTLSLTPTVTGFGATVGLGVTLTGAVISGGINYTGAPTVTFSAPDVGINTATGNWTSIVGNVLQNFQITNPGSGYFKIPTVTVSGGGGTGAGVTITQMIVTDVKINNSGYGVIAVPSANIIANGSGASANVTPQMGIGSVDVIGFGSGYNLSPGIAVTAVDGVTGSGAAVIAGLGVTSSNIVVTNPGTGYTNFPSVTITASSGSPTVQANGRVGCGITGIQVTNAGIGYTLRIPDIIVRNSTAPGVGLTATVSTVFVTNVIITNTGTGYTATDLATAGIATYSPVGTSSTVGFGVSTVTVTNSGIGYTTAASASITFSAPNLGIGTTATATASLGFPGILPGPGVSTTGLTAIYYVASVGISSIGISTGVGVGTFTAQTVGDTVFSTDKPTISIGGSVTNVSIVSPGSGYTTGSRITALNFDGANVGSGFSFTSSTVVNNYQFSDVMILHSVGSASTSCDYLEFGTIANNDILGSFNADISGSNARLLFTPTYRNNTIKVSSHNITV